MYIHRVYLYICLYIYVHTYIWKKFPLSENWFLMYLIVINRGLFLQYNAAGHSALTVCLPNFKMPGGSQDDFNSSLNYYRDLSCSWFLSCQSQVAYLNCWVVSKMKSSRQVSTLPAWVSFRHCCVVVRYEWWQYDKVKLLAVHFALREHMFLLFLEVTTPTPPFHRSGYSSFHFWIVLLHVHEHKKKY